MLWHCWLGNRKGIRPVKRMGDGGGGHCLIRIEWHAAGWLVCLPLLIFIFWHSVALMSSHQMPSMFLESCWCWICHLTSTSLRSVLSASFSYEKWTNVLLTMIQLLLSSVQSLIAGLTTMAVFWSVVQSRCPRSCGVSSVLLPESSPTLTSTIEG